MAERRIIAAKIVKSTDFLTLSPQAQCLYFHVNMDSDDEGVCNRAVIAARECGASKACLQSLVDAGFLIEIGKNLHVVRHWFVSNEFVREKDGRRKFAFKESVYRAALAEKLVLVDGVYEEIGGEAAEKARKIAENRAENAEKSGENAEKSGVFGEKSGENAQKNCVSCGNSAQKSAEKREFAPQYNQTQGNSSEGNSGKANASEKSARARVVSFADFAQSGGNQGAFAGESSVSPHLDGEKALESGSDFAQSGGESLRFFASAGEIGGGFGEKALEKSCESGAEGWKTAFREAFNLLKSNGLPCRKGDWATFAALDAPPCLERMRKIGCRAEDFLQGARNYVAAFKASEKGRGAWFPELDLKPLVCGQSRTFESYFLPSVFDVSRFRKKGASALAASDSVGAEEAARLGAMLEA